MQALKVSAPPTTVFLLGLRPWLPPGGVKASIYQGTDTSVAQCLRHCCTVGIPSRLVLQVFNQEVRSSIIYLFLANHFLAVLTGRQQLHNRALPCSWFIVVSLITPSYVRAEGTQPVHSTKCQMKNYSILRYFSLKFIVLKIKPSSFCSVYWFGLISPARGLLRGTQWLPALTG